WSSATAPSTTPIAATVAESWHPTWYAMYPPEENPATYTLRVSSGTCAATIVMIAEMKPRSSILSRLAAPQQVPAFQSEGYRPNRPPVPSGYATRNRWASASESMPDCCSIAVPVPELPCNTITNGHVSVSPDVLTRRCGGTCTRNVLLSGPTTVTCCDVPADQSALSPAEVGP